MSRPPSASASPFQPIFNSAVDAYEKRTKKDIRSHPLLSTLQSCHSPEDIVTLLREQFPAFSQSRNGDDTSSKWLIPTVKVLNSFSAVLGEGVGLVNPTIFLLRDFGSDAVLQVFSPANLIFAGIGVLLLVCTFHNSTA